MLVNSLHRVRKVYQCLDFIINFIAAGTTHGKGEVRPLSHKWYFHRIWNETKIWSALVENVIYQPQRNFAHVTTVQLSWHVQNFVVIDWACFTLQRSKFWSNFEFDQNTISGTGAWSLLRLPFWKIVFQQVVKPRFGLFTLVWMCLIKS